MRHPSTRYLSLDGTHCIVAENQDPIVLPENGIPGIGILLLDDTLFSATLDSIPIAAFI